MREAGGYTGPNDEPGWNGNAKMSGSEGFYLGCRWIFSAKDIPVPEEVKEGWEKLLHSARIENEGKRQNILAQWRLQWQKEEFRRRLEQNDVMAKGAIKSPFDGTTCQCPTCGILVPVTILGDGCLNPEPNKYCAYCVNPDGSITEYTFGSAQARDAWVQQQKQACGCEDSRQYPDCGKIDYWFTSWDEQNKTHIITEEYRCCGIWPFPRCDGTKRYITWDCGLKCHQEFCGEEMCVRTPGTERKTCYAGSSTHYDCSNCCNNPCEPPRCGAPCIDPEPSCGIYNTYEKITTDQCICQ